MYEYWHSAQYWVISGPLIQYPVYISAPIIHPIRLFVYFGSLNHHSFSDLIKLEHGINRLEYYMRIYKLCIYTYMLFTWPKGLQQLLQHLQCNWRKQMQWMPPTRPSPKKRHKQCKRCFKRNLMMYTGSNALWIYRKDAIHLIYNVYPRLRRPCLFKQNNCRRNLKFLVYFRNLFQVHFVQWQWRGKVILFWG